jgi:hypothetical protein
LVYSPDAFVVAAKRIVNPCLGLPTQHRLFLSRLPLRAFLYFALGFKFVEKLDNEVKTGADDGVVLSW